MKNSLIKSKRAAMEMSVGTIVVIVLAMTMLVLGIFLVQRIFGSGERAIDSIDTEVQNQIQKLFGEEGGNIAIYPTSREIILKKGDSPKGFAFSVRNSDVEDASFEFEVIASDISKCGSGFTKERAEDYLLGGSGTFNLGPGNSLDFPRLVRFQIPDIAPPCPIIYNLEIIRNGNNYASVDILVTIR